MPAAGGKAAPPGIAVCRKQLPWQGPPPAVAKAGAAVPPDEESGSEYDEEDTHHRNLTSFNTR